MIKSDYIILPLSAPERKNKSLFIYSEIAIKEHPPIKNYYKVYFKGELLEDGSKNLNDLFVDKNCCIPLVIKDL